VSNGSILAPVVMLPVRRRGNQLDYLSLQSVGEVKAPHRCARSQRIQL